MCVCCSAEAMFSVNMQGLCVFAHGKGFWGGLWDRHRQRISATIAPATDPGGCISNSTVWESKWLGMVWEGKNHRIENEMSAIAAIDSGIWLQTKLLNLFHDVLYGGRWYEGVCLSRRGFLLRFLTRCRPSSASNWLSQLHQANSERLVLRLPILFSQPEIINYDTLVAFHAGWQNFLRNLKFLDGRKHDTLVTLTMPTSLWVQTLQSRKRCDMIEETTQLLTLIEETTQFFIWPHPDTVTKLSRRIATETC